MSRPSIRTGRRAEEAFALRVGVVGDPAQHELRGRLDVVELFVQVHEQRLVIGAAVEVQELDGHGQRSSLEGGCERRCVLRVASVTMAVRSASTRAPATMPPDGRGGSRLR
jgi:hypothetical protein